MTLSIRSFAVVAAFVALPAVTGCVAESGGGVADAVEVSSGETAFAWSQYQPMGNRVETYNTVTQNGCLITAMKRWSTAAPGSFGYTEERVTLFMRSQAIPKAEPIKVPFQLEVPLEETTALKLGDAIPLYPPCAAGSAVVYQDVHIPDSYRAIIGANRAVVLAHASQARVAFVSNAVRDWYPTPANVHRSVKGSLRSVVTGAEVASIKDLYCYPGSVELTSQSLDAAGTLVLTGTKGGTLVGVGETAPVRPNWRATYVGFGSSASAAQLPTTLTTW